MGKFGNYAMEAIEKYLIPPGESDFKLVTLEEIWDNLSYRMGRKLVDYRVMYSLDRLKWPFIIDWKGDVKYKIGGYRDK